MATSRSLEKLARRLRIRSEELKEGVSDIMRKAAIRADQVAAASTPVDTGRARANWIASIGAPTLEEQATSRATNEANIKSHSLDKGSIYLTNNVPYIIPLDNGSSRQAPAGMSRQAIAAAAKVVRSSTTVFERR